MNPKLKSQIKLLATAFTVVSIFLAVIVWLIIEYAPKPYQLKTIKIGKYYKKTFTVQQLNGKYVPMNHVYCLKNKHLSTDDVIKILKASNGGHVWTATFDDKNYTRWRRSDNKIEATHRKKDGKIEHISEGICRVEE